MLVYVVEFEHVYNVKVFTASSCTIFELFNVERLGVSQGNGTIRQITFEFLLAVHCNYGHILYRFRDKA